MDHDGAVAHKDESFPRYGLSGDHEVAQIICFGEGARYERLRSYLAGVAVDLEVEAEGVVDLAALLGDVIGPDPNLLVVGVVLRLR